MNRPCVCDRCKIGEPFDHPEPGRRPEQCRVCWLFHNRADYHTLWGGTNPPETDTPDTPPKTAPMPSLLRQGVNFITAVGQHVAAGLPVVEDTEKERRLTICNGCEFYAEPRCLKCGCNMKVKAGWAEQKCPVGKWDQG